MLVYLYSFSLMQVRIQMRFITHTVSVTSKRALDDGGDRCNMAAGQNATTFFSPFPFDPPNLSFEEGSAQSRHTDETQCFHSLKLILTILNTFLCSPVSILHTYKFTSAEHSRNSEILICIYGPFQCIFIQMHNIVRHFSYLHCKLQFFCL